MTTTSLRTRVKISTDCGVDESAEEQRRRLEELEEEPEWEGECVVVRCQCGQTGSPKLIQYVLILQ